MTPATQGPAGRGDLPVWLRTSSVAWIGALLASVTLALAAGFLEFQADALEKAEVQSAELYARVLQDHADRTFDTVDVVLASVADDLASDRVPWDGVRVSHALMRSRLGFAFLRSLAVMDADGRVLASSIADEVGTIVDPARIPFPVAGAGDSLGSSVAGRGLGDARAGAPAGPSHRVHSFVPLVRRVTSASGAVGYLVAVLNPDFFANAHALALDEPSRAAALVGLDGVMLTGTSGLARGPGDRVGEHRVFTHFLPKVEAASFVGPGIDGNKSVSAFRMLRKWPVLVVAERRYDAVRAGLLHTALWTAGAAFASLAVIGAMCVTAGRSLRAHAQVLGTLAATRAAVADNERDLRVLVESVHELIFRADAQGRVTFVNGRWAELTGRPVSEILGERFASACAADERAAVDAMFTARREGGDTLRVSTTSAAGRVLVLDLSVSTVVAGGGEVVGYAAFAVDVTERESSRQALESQSKFTAQLLDVSPTPLFVKDRAGRFTTVNRAWLDLMGFTLEQVIGDDSSGLYGSSGPLHSSHDARLLASGERAVYENRLVVNGRPPRDTVVTKVRFTDADGEAAGIVGSIFDVTEFREAERRIREARDAAALADSAKSEFIANMSHELRTPLQSIIGFSELGIELGRDATDSVDLFTDIHASGLRMLVLVNGLLDVSQMECVVGSLQLQPVDLAALVREAVAQLRPRSTVRAQSVRLRGLDAPCRAAVDAARFQQAVRNVVANAVHLSPAGSEIVVECARADGGVALTVRDRGPGIPEDELESIFEAFVQSSRTRGGAGGAGLGLTIARKIMGAHGGSVVAANAEGGGAVLRLWLPASADAPEEAPAARRSDQALPAEAP